MVPLLTRDQLLGYWLGHRRAIEVFPSDKGCASFPVGGLRPFTTLANEFLGMSFLTLTGIVSSEWPMDLLATRAAALVRWDADTERIEALWPQIPEGRFQEADTAFGQWTMPVWDLLLYVIDNEVHHRGQGYVSLRALSVEPPAFPDRD